MAWKKLVLLGCLLPTAVAAQLPATPRPAIRFTPDEVSAAGLTPGGPVVWFSIWRQVEAYAAHYSRHERLGHADREGIAVFPAEERLPEQAIWGVVDLASGTWTLATPAGFPLRRVVPRSAVSRSPGSEADRLVDPRREFLAGFLVRPGEGGGAWVFSGGDGGSIDEDQLPNGHLAIALDRLDPIGASPAPPGKLGDQDLWFVVEPYEMTISVQRGGVAQ